MPRSSFQKLKIIYIMEYLLKNSDEEHAVTTSQIIAYLKSHDITAERKTIYSDIEALRDFGLDIIQVSEGNNHGYYVASRDFELPELKLLVDSVQSSKFITHKKTLSLIKKIEGNTAQIAYRESHSKLVCRAASIIPSVRLAGRINSGCQAGPVSQDQVRQSEQHIQFSGLLPQAPVPCLSVSEPTLDDRKYVFHFSANG